MEAVGLLAMAQHKAIDHTMLLIVAARAAAQSSLDANLLLETQPAVVIDGIVLLAAQPWLSRLSSAGASGTSPTVR